MLLGMQRDFVFVRIYFDTLNTSPNGMRKFMLLSFSTELESLRDFTSFFHLMNELMKSLFVAIHIGY